MWEGDVRRMTVAELGPASPARDLPDSSISVANGTRMPACGFAVRCYS